MAMDLSSSRSSPPHFYCTPKSRRKNIRTVADVSTPSSNCSSTNSKRSKSICCICLEVIHHPDVAGIESCDHLYHRDCIESWSRIENACPLCKQRFLFINHISDNNKKIAVAKKDQEAAYHIDLGNIIWVDCVCVKCGSDDHEQLLLLCDGCDAAMHTYCVGLGDNVPDDDYFCETCRSHFGALVAHDQDINDSEDEDYQPSPQRKRRRSARNRNTNREIRRSQRIRNIQTATANIDINIDVNNDNIDNHNHNRCSRARSVSPSSPNRVRNNNENNAPRPRTQRIMVMDQNNNTHLLGFKRNGHGMRFNSLANLFAHDHRNDVSRNYNLSQRTNEAKLKKKLEKAKSKIACVARKTSISSLSFLSVDGNHTMDKNDDEKTESEYTPSDEEHNDNLSDYGSDSEDDDDDDDMQENIYLRRSKRLLHRKLDVVDVEKNNDNIPRRNPPRNSRKRKFREFQKVQHDCNKMVSARKRVKKMPTSSARKYSSLALL